MNKREGTIIQSSGSSNNIIRGLTAIGDFEHVIKIDGGGGNEFDGIHVVDRKTALSLLQQLNDERDSGTPVASSLGKIKVILDALNIPHDVLETARGWDDVIGAVKQYLGL